MEAEIFNWIGLIGWGLLGLWELIDDTPISKRYYFVIWITLMVNLIVNVINH